MRDDRAGYVELVTGEMLAACAPHARWVDVFCEPHSPHAFTGEESRQILQAGKDAGLQLRVHGNQLSYGAGVRLAVELGAASVDHVNYLSDSDIEKLAASETVATMLPACDLSTREPLAPGRALLDAGATLAIASNLNPGTSYTSSMNYCVTTAVLQQYLSVDEAIHAATTGGEVHGVDHVVYYRREDVAARVREITGGAGVPVVLDSIGAAADLLPRRSHPFR